MFCTREYLQQRRFDLLISSNLLGTFFVPQLLENAVPALTFQSHSPLISSNSEMFQVWFSPENLWNSANSELNSTHVLRESPGQYWFLTGSMTLLGNFFHFLKIFKCTSISRLKFLFSIQFVNINEKQNFFVSIISRSENITTNRKFGFSVTDQLAKLIGFKFSKTFSRLVG